MQAPHASLVEGYELGQEFDADLGDAEDALAGAGAIVALEAPAAKAKEISAEDKPAEKAPEPAPTPEPKPAEEPPKPKVEDKTPAAKEPEKPTRTVYKPK